MKPRARREGIVVRELDGETLVYDRERHRAHCLNATAAAVFRLCDGTRSAEELAAALQRGPAGPDREALVRSALAQLSCASLVVDAEKTRGAVLADADGPAEASRRGVLQQLGAALLLPAVATIVAPTPAQAASDCITSDDCAIDPVGNQDRRCSVSGFGDCRGFDCGTCGHVIQGNCDAGGIQCPFP